MWRLPRLGLLKIGSEDAPTPQRRTAVATKATNAVATSSRNMNAIKDLKDAYKVQYNSLAADRLRRAILATTRISVIELSLS